MEGKIKLWIALVMSKRDFPRGLWCYVGDFNAGLHRNEKKCIGFIGNHVKHYELQHYVDDMELLGILVLGGKYTCFSSDALEDKGVMDIEEKIYMFLLSEGGEEEWRITTQCMGDTDVLNHCPI